MRFSPTPTTRDLSTQHSALKFTRLGLLGGSFNPVHNGHLAIARQAREALGLDQNPLRSHESASP